MVVAYFLFGHFTPAGHHYQALLLVRGNSAGQLEALRGKRVALSDPASTSGSLVPRVEFSAQTGVPLAQFFGSVAYSGSHDNALDALLDGRVDAAFVASVRADAYFNSGRIAADTLKVLWRSDRIYYDPYVFRGGLCPALKDGIRRAMFEEPGALTTFFASQNASGIAPVGHGEYAKLLEMMQNASVP